MLKVIEDIGKEKFISIVIDAEAAIQVAKRKITNKYSYIIAIRCIAHHINLIIKDIISIKYVKITLQKCQQIISFFHKTHKAEAALHDKIITFFSIGDNLKSSVKTRWSIAW